MPQKPLIFATAIAEYIAHGSCPRRAKLTLAQNEIVRRLPFAGRVFAPLDVALKTSGAAREQAWEQFLRTAGLRALNERADKPAAAGFPLLPVRIVLQGRSVRDRRQPNP